MSVHYKFKAESDFSTVTFDGNHITVSELKKAIINHKRLAKNPDLDLQIINARTNEVYSEENALIPEHASLIVTRVRTDNNAWMKSGSLLSNDGKELNQPKTVDADDDPSHYVRIRGANQHGRVPDNYRCNRCNQPGHWINKCPNVPVVIPGVKPSTGIPRSHMIQVGSPDIPGALITPEGKYAVPRVVDRATNADKLKGHKQQARVQPPKPKKVPDSLLCTLCNDLLSDAVSIPCCANSYCDDCIKSHLIESDQECPDCQEKEISHTDLTPNRFLRSAAIAFKRDTGYTKR